MSRHRTNAKKAPPEIGLHMECTEEELEPCQIVHYNKAETEYNEIQNKLDNYLSKMNAEVIEKGENCMVLQLNVSTPNNTSSQASPVNSAGKVTRQSVQGAQNYQQVINQGILTRSTSNAPANTYLVMDPRLGLVVGQVAQNESATSPPSKQTPTRTRSSPGTVTMTTRARSGGKKLNMNETEVVTSNTPRTREKAKSQVQGQQAVSPPAVAQVLYAPGSAAPSSVSYRIKVNAKPLQPQVKLCESTAVGGLTTGSKTPWKPNTDESGAKGNAADSKEVTFNKMSGKTFPSLVVAAKPHLSLKYILQSTITQERTNLDAKVKGVLMYIPLKFTEWLMQEGLIKSEQHCQVHVNQDLTPVKFKLGIYSNASKFLYSGGYIWTPPCCSRNVISVFSGSIFEGAPHPPTTILKLIYHWACQTNVQNVVQWVKVDNLYVKNFFTNMRAVCTGALHQKCQKMGGPRSHIEVGMISLGTTSQDGNMRQVKVEVLGVMDAENKLIRLRALEPLSDEKNFKRRFTKILEPLEDWVHKESTIFTDFTVDKGTLLNMGFRTVYQVSASDRTSKYSNHNVMEYLRRIVPRMFQNTLSLLSRQIIQQFLDELVWREMWGSIPSQAFDMIIADIAEQTKLDASEGLLSRLNKVAANPFKNWNYSVWKTAPVTLSNTKPYHPASDLDAVPFYNRLTAAETPEQASSIFKNIRTRKRTAEQVAEPAPPPVLPPKRTIKVAAKDKAKKEEKPKLLEPTFKKETMEKDKDITEEIVAFINGKGSQVSLESYYYGVRDGDGEMIASEYKGQFQVGCSVCNRKFKDNVALMRHMVLHAQLEPPLAVAISFAQQCDYCFLGFHTSIELKEHMDGVHPSCQPSSRTLTECRICEENFSNRVELIYHMHRTHVEMEMPYECGVCYFRCSSYKNFVDHFMATHKGGEHVFCPFCLKVVAFSQNGKLIPSNVWFFENHLEKHNRTALTKKCNRCKLSFIHKGIHAQHLEADHISFKDEIGVRPIESSSNSVKMPVPGTIIKPISSPKSVKIYRARPLFRCTKFKALEMNGIDDDMSCVECEGSLDRPDHFGGSFNCLKCRYATCCERAMSEHTTIFHESPTLQFTMGRPTVLEAAMFCACGYSCYSGNKIAKHLANCERKTAYASEEAADAAGIGRSESPSAAQNGESQNMLNMLGLMRKSPESGAASTETKKESDPDDDNNKAEEQPDESAEIRDKTDLNVPSDVVEEVDKSKEDTSTVEESAVVKETSKVLSEENALKQDDNAMEVDEQPNEITKNVTDDNKSAPLNETSTKESVESKDINVINVDDRDEETSTGKNEGNVTVTESNSMTADKAERAVDVPSDQITPSSDVVAEES